MMLASTSLYFFANSEHIVSNTKYYFTYPRTCLSPAFSPVTLMVPPNSLSKGYHLYMGHGGLGTKDTKHEVRQAEGPPARIWGPEGPKTSSTKYFIADPKLIILK